ATRPKAINDAFAQGFIGPPPLFGAALRRPDPPTLVAARSVFLPPSLDPSHLFPSLLGRVREIEAVFFQQEKLGLDVGIRGGQRRSEDPEERVPHQLRIVAGV